jgi:hypothetical protein
MRRHLTYANVMATLGVFIALGGTSYAAIKITGKNVKDRSLTGKDIKPRSVPVDRLKGKLPGGPAGAQGLPGPQGPKGEPGNVATVDTSAFLQTGELRISAPAQDWEPGTPGTGTKLAQGPKQVTITDSSAELTPTLPVVLANRSLKLKALDLCYGSDSDINVVRAIVHRSNRTGAPSEATTVPGVDMEPGTRSDAGCRVYELPAPVTLTADDLVTAQVGRAGSAALELGRTTFIFDLV